MPNNINRAIIDFLASDDLDPTPAEIITIKNNIENSNSSIIGTNYFFNTGKWHIKSLKSLLYGDNAPLDWYNKTFKSGTGGHNESKNHYIKISSTIERKINGQSNNEFQGNLQIEIHIEDKNDECLIDNITNRIYYLLLRCHNTYQCDNQMICFKNPKNGIISSLLAYVNTQGNYEKQIISYNIRNLIQINDFYIN